MFGGLSQSLFSLRHLLATLSNQAIVLCCHLGYVILRVLVLQALYIPIERSL